MTPVLMAVSDDGELSPGSNWSWEPGGADYEIVCGASAETADAAIVRLSEEGRGVAVVLADQWLSGVSGPGLLAPVGELHPQAQQGLLIPWGSGQRPMRCVTPRRWGRSSSGP